jgi:hypothetical protein
VLLSTRGQWHTIIGIIPGNTYGGIAAIILLPSGVGLMPRGDEMIACSIDFIDYKTIDLNKRRESWKQDLKSISKIML